MDMRIIRRLAYDGNYQRAIEMICDVVESQQELIKSQNKVISEQQALINKITESLKGQQLISQGLMTIL